MVDPAYPAVVYQVKKNNLCFNVQKSLLAEKIFSVYFFKRCFIRIAKQIELTSNVEEPRVYQEVHPEEPRYEEIEEDQKQTAFFDCRMDMEGWELQTWIEEQTLAAKEKKEIEALINKAKDPANKRYGMVNGLAVKIESGDKRKQEATAAA